MVGLYETAIDALCEDITGETAVRPKYIASTATVRQARDQVQALFGRALSQFPPPGLDSDNSFFAVSGEPHPASLAGAGRVYLGVAAPGKGAQTPIVRIWATLLQAVEYARQRQQPPVEIDPFWTLVGYFNAIRELAGVAGLYRQDIPQWLGHLALRKQQSARDTRSEAIELSSRADSLLLPSLLSRLEIEYPQDAVVAALATSMFGTGVDVSRLGLMVMHGQPKTSSAYIQATGRVGRDNPGLVVTFLRASRPRDLDHYEFFTGYHRQLYRSVEPITVAPFSPRARERALGPVCTALLRQATQLAGQPVARHWAPDTGAPSMANHRQDPDVLALYSIFEDRAQLQPDGRRPQPGVTGNETSSELDCWYRVARTHGNRLKYVEYAIQSPPQNPVVLGDPQHQQNRLDVAYENAPQSLREVEATTGFRA